MLPCPLFHSLLHLLHEPCPVPLPPPLPLPVRSYLYVRMLCNPQLYGVPIDALDTDPLLQVSLLI